MRGLRNIAESMSAYRNVGKCIVKKAIPNKTAVIINSLIIKFFFVMVFHSSDKSKKTITNKKLDKKPIIIKKSIWFFL